MLMDLSILQLRVSSSFSSKNRADWYKIFSLYFWHKEYKKLWLIDILQQVNHAQVASGEVDQGVVDNDIDAEISEEEAHNNYGIRVADWLALSALHLELLDGSQAQQSLLNFVQYEKETEEFLEPFKTMYHLEQEGYVSQYVSDMQVLLYF